MATFTAGLIAFLEALAALPKIGEQVGRVLSEITGWWTARTEAKAQEAISSAEQAQKAARTREERLAAARRWQEVFRQGRVEK